MALRWTVRSRPAGYPPVRPTLARGLLAVTAGLAVLAAAACGSDTAATPSSTAGVSVAPSAGSNSADSSASNLSASDSSASDGSATDSSATDSSATGSSAGSAPDSSAPSGSGSSSTGSAGGGAAVGGECVPGQLKTTTPNVLTVATSEPAFEPWMVDNEPTNGKGYESAVAYAVAAQLGYTKDQVSWKRVGFDEAIAKQDGWDFDLNQYSITEDRKRVVDFSSGYYDVTQAVITVKGSKLEGATTVAALKTAKLGAMNGTTSLNAVNTVIQPAERPNIFDDNALAAQALQNGQIDGLVVDLPTGFYMVGAQVKDGMMVGQLPGTASTQEQFGLLLAKGSPVTSCASKAVDALRANGTLKKLANQWLGGKGAAPSLK